MEGIYRVRVTKVAIKHSVPSCKAPSWFYGLEPDQLNELTYDEVCVRIKKTLADARYFKSSSVPVTEEVWSQLRKYHQWILRFGKSPALVSDPSSDDNRSWQRVQHYCDALLSAL